MSSITHELRPPGFLDGLRCFWGGLGFVLATPTVWPLAVVPMLLLVTVWGVLGWGAVHWVPVAVDQWVAPGRGAWVGYGLIVLKFLVAGMAVVLAGLVGFVLAQPLAGPALERIVRARERALGAAPRPPTGLFIDMWCALQSVLVSYAFGIPLLFLLFLLSVVVPVAVVVTVPLKLLVSSFLIAWDLCDYPLAIHGLKVSRRIRLISRHRRAVLGFGLGLAIAHLVPCLLFLLLPAGVAGAAQLVLKIERYESAAGSSAPG